VVARVAEAAVTGDADALKYRRDAETLVGCWLNTVLEGDGWLTSFHAAVAVLALPYTASVADDDATGSSPVDWPVWHRSLLPTLSRTALVGSAV